MTRLRGTNSLLVAAAVVLLALSLGLLLQPLTAVPEYGPPSSSRVACGTALQSKAFVGFGGGCTAVIGRRQALVAVLGGSAVLLAAVAVARRRNAVESG
jgi:hypothetical protein